LPYERARGCWHAPRATGRGNIDEETHATEQRTNLKRLRDAAHARGSAMILSHAERLASLVEGTPAYTQCIELTARDIEI
jgi:hypothetical protein